MAESPADLLRTRSDESSISLEFDDIIYSLQPFGGISEYWHEMTSRIEQTSGLAVRRRTGTTWGRMRGLRSGSRVFHSSYYRTAIGGKTATVVTVHDLAYELGHVGRGIAARLHRLEHRRAYFAADALICISNSTRRDLLQVYPTLATRCEIHVVPHGVSMSSAPRGDLSTAPAPVLPPYVLFVGGRDAYKNFGAALHGFNLSRLAKQGFILACTGHPLSESEQRQVAHLGLQNSVRALGRVSRTELGSLYASAHCLLYPSLFEGFGLPLLEAMKMGCPVVAANCSAMPEVAADAALLIDATNPATMASALLTVGEGSTRKRLVAAGFLRAEQFSWSRCAAEHARVYRSLL